MLLGRAIRRAGRVAVSSVLDAAYRDRFEAPHGPVWLDPTNNHCHLTPRIAVSRADFQFDIFWESAVPVRPDPYLARLDLEDLTGRAGPSASRQVPYLRVVK
jgi:branched-chain amino acid transport system substrate-binding protein